MTNPKPGTLHPAKITGDPGHLLLAITVAVLSVVVLALATLAVLDPISLISLTPDWFAATGTAQIIAATALTLLITGLLGQAVRLAGRGHDHAATWVTLTAMLLVPWFSVI